MSDAPITLFVPFGSGYGNPGLTIRAESTEELQAILDNLSNPVDDDPDSPSNLNDLLDGVLTIKSAVALKFPQEDKPKPQAYKPSPQVTAPASDNPSCSHGPMKWKEGTSRAGNAYKGWFCTAPLGQTQCKAQFIK